MHKTIALVVAAGSSNRFGKTIPKQYNFLNKVPIIRNVVENLLHNKNIDFVRVIINKDHEHLRELTLSNLSQQDKLLPHIYGGERRQDSVRLGLESLEKLKPHFVIIHDSCRPLTPLKAVEQVLVPLKNQRQIKGVVPVISIVDTVKIVENNLITGAIDRNAIKMVQTPQAFCYSEILQCHRISHKNNPTQEYTDDSSIMLAHNFPVITVEGDDRNFKITTFDHLEKAEMMLKDRKFNSPRFRIGSGYDIHRFISTPDLGKTNIMVCGVSIPYNKKIKAHSDGDVGIHALVDAILGAIGCGDIGQIFSPTDNRWKDMNSSYFLQHAVQMAKEKGYVISNTDITIICEEPKISLYSEKMRQTIANLLEIDYEFVNIKGTTTEKLGSLGRGEGIAAQAIVMCAFLN